MKWKKEVEVEVEVVEVVVDAIDRSKPKKKRILTLVLDSADLDDRLVDEVLLRGLPRCFDFGELGHGGMEERKRKKEKERD